MDKRTQEERTPAFKCEDLKGKLMELLKLHNDNRIDYNDRKWETLKFFQTIVTALLGATVAALIALAINDKFNEWLLLLAVVTLPIAAIFASHLARSNLYRESRLLFREELQIFKIARLLGLDIDLPEKFRWLRDDEHLLLNKWRHPQSETGCIDPKDIPTWLDARMSNHEFYIIFKKLFWAEEIIGWALMGLVAVQLYKILCFW